jgi:putative ABC transport system substrate-binding protein
MRRRAFIAGLGSAAMWPLVARAQPERYRRVAILSIGGPSDGFFRPSLTAFGKELAVHGWIEGNNTKIEVYPTGGDEDVYRSKADLLTRDPPDVIVVSSNPGLFAVMKATATIPVVFIRVGDPVATGAILNLAHPGGNVTGFTDHEASLGGKWLELLTEVAPGTSRALVLYRPATATQRDYIASIEGAASALNVTPTAIGVHDNQDIEHAIEGFLVEGRGGLIALPNIITLAHRDLIVGLAAKYGLPGAFPFPSFIKAGGLLFYGVSDSYLYRGAAGYVDRILRGEKPGELPVQTPTKFELVINLKTAKAMGLSVPPSLLARADEVIE